MTSPPPLITLAIETSNPSTCDSEVAVGRRNHSGAGELLSCQTLTPTNRHDDALAPAIDRAVRQAGLTPGDLDRIAVSVGPGGFTSLRIAVASAKGIALATGARCVAVPTALIAASRAFEQDDALGCVAVALASKRDSAWIAVIDRTSDLETQSAAAGEAMDLAGLAQVIDSHRVDTVIADEHLPTPMHEWLGKQAIAMAPPALGAAQCLDLSWELPERASVELAPIYPRPPEAVRKWRELHG